MRRRNDKRHAKKMARNYDGEDGGKADWIRSFPCIVPGCWRFSCAAHMIARGMGGAKGDSTVLSPLCWHHHAEAGEYRSAARVAFEVRYELTRGEPGEGMVLIARELDAKYVAGEPSYGAPF